MRVHEVNKCETDDRGRTVQILRLMSTEHTVQQNMRMMTAHTVQNMRMMIADIVQSVSMMKAHTVLNMRMMTAHTVQQSMRMTTKQTVQ